MDAVVDLLSTDGEVEKETKKPKADSSKPVAAEKSKGKEEVAKKKEKEKEKKAWRMRRVYFSIFNYVYIYIIHHIIKKYHRIQL